MTVFRSVSQALHVSHIVLSLPPNSKGQMQRLVEQRAAELGIRREEERGTVDFRGLTPLEVRAQCAMVIAAVQDHCAAPERAAIAARYALDASKAQAITFLCHYCSPQYISVESDTAQQLILWNIHAIGANADRVTTRAIAAETQISMGTLNKNIAVISAICSTLRRVGTDRLEPFFVRDGLVEDRNHATA